jgi:predicted SpoU family rRNA methylase
MNLLHIVLTMHGQKKNKILKNQMKFKKQVLILVLAQWM